MPRSELTVSRTRAGPWRDGGTFPLRQRSRARAPRPGRLRRPPADPGPGTRPRLDKHREDRRREDGHPTATTRPRGAGGASRAARLAIVTSYVATTSQGAPPWPPTSGTSTPYMPMILLYRDRRLARSLLVLPLTESTAPISAWIRSQSSMRRARTSSSTGRVARRSSIPRV